MSPLFRIVLGRAATPVAEAPFAHEVADLEETLWANPSVLGDGIQMVARQLDTGVGGRIDLVAIERSDAAAQLVIIELKNTEATPDVLLQALRYASWARSNPDSIRLHLLQAGIQIDHGQIDFTPKVVIVASAIRSDVVELSQYVTAFSFDFFTIRRFEATEEYLILLDRLAPKATPGVATSRQEEWSWERFQNELRISEPQIARAKAIYAHIVSLIEERGWNLTPRFRKWYVPFQYGGRNVVTIHFSLAQHVGLGIRLPQSPDDLGLNVTSDGVQVKYDPNYKTLNIYVPVAREGFEIAEYEPVLREAYETIAGNR